MKRIGLGTYTVVDGVEVENGIMVEDDFPEADLTPEGDTTPVDHSFEPHDRIRIILDAYRTGEDGPLMNDTGTVQEVIGDATGRLYVTFDTDGGMVRTVPTEAVERV